MLRRFSVFPLATKAATSVASVATTSLRRGSFATHVFDGRIDYTELFPYPTCDRTQAEEGARTVKEFISTQKDLHESGKLASSPERRKDAVSALLAAQMPALAPEKQTAQNRFKDLNANCVTHDCNAWLVQEVLEKSSRPHEDITGKLASHLSVGSYLLRTLAAQFSVEVHNAAVGDQTVVTLVNEKSCGSYVTGATARAHYDEEKNVYLLSGEKYTPSALPLDFLNDNNNNNNNNNNKAPLLLVLARAETQVSDPQTGELVIAHRLAWFPVDLSNKETAKAVKFNKEKIDGGAGVTVSFSSTPVPGGNVLGAIGDGFRHSGVATLSTVHVGAASIVGIVRRVVSELVGLTSSLSSSSSDSSSMSSSLVPLATLNLLRSRAYALESATYAFATNLDRNMSDTITESACLSVSAFALARDVKNIIASDVLPFLLRGDETNQGEGEEAKVLESCARALYDLMTTTISGHPDHMSMLAACCGVEDYGLKMNRRPFVNLTALRTQRSMGIIDRFPSLVSCQNQAKVLEKQIVKFSDGIHAAFVNNGPAILNRQALLCEIGEAAAVLYLASCTLARVNRCVASKRASTATDEQLAALFLDRALPDIDVRIERFETEATQPSKLANRMNKFCTANYSSADFFDENEEEEEEGESEGDKKKKKK